MEDGAQPVVLEYTSPAVRPAPRARPLDTARVVGPFTCGAAAATLLLVEGTGWPVSSSAAAVVIVIVVSGLFLAAGVRATDAWSRSGGRGGVEARSWWVSLGAGALDAGLLGVAAAVAFRLGLYSWPSGVRWLAGFGWEALVHLAWAVVLTRARGEGGDVVPPLRRSP